MSKLRKWFYRNYDFSRSCIFWVMVGSLMFSAGAVGYFVAMARASGWMAQQREDTIQSVQSLQSANARLVGIIESRLPAITSSVDDAARAAKEAANTAKDAAQAASGAGSTARKASTKAQRAASTAEKAANALNDALEPAPVSPRDAPDWLGGS